MSEIHLLRICPEFLSSKNLEITLTPHIYNLSMSLEKKGVKQEILTQHTDLQEVGGIPIHRFSSKPPFSFLRTGLFAYEKIKKLKKEFDIIHFHNPGTALITLKRKNLPPLIMTIHDSPVEIIRNINLFNLRQMREAIYFYFLSYFASKRVDAVTFVSPYVAKSIIKKFKLPKEKVYSITSGVDTNLFKPIKKEKKYDLIYVGRFAPKKQPLLFVRVIKELKKIIPKIKVAMIGGTGKDILFNNTISEIKRLGLEKNIDIISPIPQKELVNYYNSTKLLLLPSYSESSPKVVLEAMSCGVPCMVNRLLGTVHIFNDKKEGFFITGKTPKEIANEVYSVLFSENLYTIGKRARKRVVDKFSWERIADQYIKVYKKVLYEREKQT